MSTSINEARDRAAAPVDVEVNPRVAVGLSTLAGGGVTVVAYLLAIIAFADGARDEATISAVVVGTIALVTTIAARIAQAVAAIKATAPVAPAVAVAPAAAAGPTPTLAEQARQLREQAQVPPPAPEPVSPQSPGVRKPPPPPKRGK
jgi:hypothetical protein